MITLGSAHSSPLFFQLLDLHQNLHFLFPHHSGKVQFLLRLGKFCLEGALEQSLAHDGAGEFRGSLFDEFELVFRNERDACGGGNHVFDAPDRLKFFLFFLNV